MNIRDFEKLCNKSKLSLVHREDRNGMVIVVADGESPKEFEDGEKIYRTAYAVGPDVENLILSQAIDFDRQLIENMRIENRVKATIEKAREITDSFSHIRSESVH